MLSHVARYDFVDLGRERERGDFSILKSQLKHRHDVIYMLTFFIIKNYAKHFFFNNLNYFFK